MKKYTPIILCLCLLTGCGRDSKPSGIDKPVDVTETQTEDTTETESEAPSETALTTTAASIPGVVTTAAGTAPPRSSHIYTGPVVTVFYGPGVLVPDWGGYDDKIYGTVSPVPMAEVPATTTAALIDPTVDPGEEPYIDVPEPTFDPKDQSVISFEVTALGVNVLRSGTVVQTLGVDTTAAYSLISGVAYSQGQLVVEEDFDFDGYRDLFIAENLNSSNMNGKYFRYDSATGTYTDWQTLNDVNWYLTANSSAGTLTTYIKYGAAEYENRVYKWSGDTLALVSMEKQYQTEDGSIFLDHYDYSSGVADLYLREQYVDGSYVEVETE